MDAAAAGLNYPMGHFGSTQRIGGEPTTTSMVFVDGENFTIRAQEIMKAEGLVIPESPAFMHNTYFWPKGEAPYNAFAGCGVSLGRIIRSHYYATVQGSPDDIVAVQLSLRKMGFEPSVFKRNKGGRSKGVDIAIATDVLSHAFLGNFDVAVLVAGDGDYRPMVEAIKRLGKIVVVGFFETNGLSPELRLAADCFVPLEDFAKRCIPH